MSTLLQFLDNQKHSPKWVKNYIIQLFKNLIIKEKKDDKEWVGLKIHHTVVPSGWSEKGVFPYLEHEYKGLILKRYKDKQ